MEAPCGCTPLATLEKGGSCALFVSVSESVYAFLIPHTLTTGSVPRVPSPPAKFLQQSGRALAPSRLRPTSMAFKGPKGRKKEKQPADDAAGAQASGTVEKKEGKARRERPGQVHPLRASATQEVVVEPSAKKRKRKSQAAARLTAAAMQHHQVGTMAHVHGDFDGAKKAFRDAIALKPDFAYAYFRLAVVIKEQA